MVAKSQEKGSLTLTLYGEINFSWGKKTKYKMLFEEANRWNREAGI
jgi:hypothetical protein